MILTEQIKSGLKFRLKRNLFQQENDSWLKKTHDSISLTYIFSSPECNLNAGDTNSTHEIEFTFHNEFLKKFSSGEQEFSIAQFPENQQHDICSNTQMLLHEIISTTLYGPFRNMFLESKALALLLCFQKCNTVSAQDCASCKFLTKPVEKNKIIKAREIILASLNNPPTIQELSIAIGINQCYLKKGFKEIFGTTVYDYVQEQRMLKAKMLLHTNKYSVSQVAEKIGFSSQSSFSAAFKKFTGVFPSELQRN